MRCSIASAGLTTTDATIVREAGSKLVSRGLVGAVREEVDDRGLHALVMLHPRNGRAMFAICRDAGRYTITGGSGEPLVEGRTLDDVIAAACSRTQNVAVRRFAEAAATVPI